MISMDGRSFIASKRKLMGIESYPINPRPDRNSASSYLNSQERIAEMNNPRLAAAGLS